MDRVAEAFKSAFLIGVAPDVFWALTPWQFGRCLDAYSQKSEQEHDRRSWLMWHGAVLARVKNVPPLKKFLSGPQKRGNKGSKNIDERAIIHQLKAYQQQRGKVISDNDSEAQR